GSLSTGTSGAVISTFAGGVWTASGAIADVNTLLAGVIFSPALNYNSTFTIATSVDDGVAPVLTGIKNVTGTAVGDTPQVGNIVTLADTPSGLIVIDRNPNDGAEVSHFRISGITNGTLYHADGVTHINDGDYIAYAQGQAGVRFKPAANSTATGSFAVESSEDGVSVTAQSSVATSVITVVPPSSAPTENNNPDTGDSANQEQDTSSEDSDRDSGEENVAQENILEEDVPREDVLEADVLAPNEGSANRSDSRGRSTRNAPRASLDTAGPGFRLASIVSMDLGDVTESRSTIQPIQNEPAASVLERKQNVQQGLAHEPISASVYEHLRNSLDALNEETVSEIQLEKAVIGSAIVVSTGLSVGYVVWLIRGGMLLSSVLSSLPAWQIADPLPILTQKKEDSESEDEESLETIIKQGSPNEAKKEKKSDS
ncbi:MAG: hypothetical protein JSU72_15700, partial [Deltaproteobacteria bacterium]